MSLEFKDSSIVLDDKEFDALEETNTGKHYFTERISIDGILNYGLVQQNEEKLISLADNNINTPLIVDRIVAFAENTTADEIYFNLYELQDGTLHKVATQRFLPLEMPLDYPDGIIMPNHILGVKPSRSNATIIVYVKPVKVLFEAVPSPSLQTINTSVSLT